MRGYRTSSLNTASPKSAGARSTLKDGTYLWGGCTHFSSILENIKGFIKWDEEGKMLLRN